MSRLSRVRYTSSSRRSTIWHALLIKVQYSILKIEYDKYQSLTTEKTYVPSQLTVLVTLTHLLCVPTCALLSAQSDSNIFKQKIGVPDKTSCYTKLVNFTHLRSVKSSCDLSLRQLWFLVLRSTKERPTQQRVSCRTLRSVPYDPTQGVTQSSTSRRSGPSYRRRVWSEGLSYSASDLLSLALSYANKAGYCGLVTPSISSILIYLVTVSYVSR